MKVHGYMIDVEWDGQELVITGTTKAARMALRGPLHDDGPVRVAREELAEVTFKDANPLTNGRITVRTTSAREFQPEPTFKLHFRRKQAADFKELYEALAG